MIEPRASRGLGLALIVAGFVGCPAAEAQPDSDQQGSSPVVKLDPLTVHASRDQSPGKRSDETYWKIQQFGQGNNFHIRGGQLVDAIIFRHDYLQQHPNGKAVVVVVTEPRFNRVTQAVTAYTVGGALRVASHALGDIAASGLAAADIDHPEKIQQFIRQLRSAYLHAAAGSGSPTMGMIMAHAEESGNYAIAGQLYDGTSDFMLDAAYHWLGDREKAGLIPLSFGKVRVDVPQPGPAGPAAGKPAVKTENQAAIVFDWDGFHYFYNDGDGMLAKPLPKNPVTGLPCLVLKEGDAMESLYFVASYKRQHPAESAVLLPAADGLHAAAAFTTAGKLFVLSPFAGRFAVPPSYRIDRVPDLCRLHAALVYKIQKDLAAKGLARPATSMPQEMPGDSEVEQVRRAYLAFVALGLPAKIVEGQTRLPGLEVSYGGASWTYAAPGFQGEPAAGSFSVGQSSL